MGVCQLRCGAFDALDGLVQRREHAVVSSEGIFGLGDPLGCVAERLFLSLKRIALLLQVLPCGLGVVAFASDAIQRRGARLSFSGRLLYLGGKTRLGVRLVEAGPACLHVSLGPGQLHFACTEFLQTC